jgi:two-component system, OmpR family, sensor histidine kinase KdpD
LKLSNTRKYPLAAQYVISIALVLIVSTICFYTASFIGYTVVALVLLMTASVIAMLFDILPVLAAAVLSAIIWNFFFIPPVYTFHIEKAEDLLMFLLYFLIALVNTVLTFKIREAEGKARDKEEKVNTIKLYNTLLNSLSHELRTPIATIVGAVDTLQEGQDKLSPDTKSELLHEIDRASIRLNRQVENLLNMSRLESGMLKLNIDWCDINELVHSVIQKVSETSRRKIDFSANDELPFFKLDRGLMEQVLQNLVHNAIQYTPENTVIRIEALYRPGICVLIVSDRGNGFPETEIQLVFDKFYRLPNTKVGGSGLGLSIVKGFVEAHRGTIVLSNSREGGAVFTIEIPAETSFINNLKNE